MLNNNNWKHLTVSKQLINIKQNRIKQEYLRLLDYVQINKL